MGKRFYSIFKTKFGWMGLMASNIGLTRVILPQPDKKNILKMVQGLVRDDKCFEKTKNSLMNYFEGKKVEFDYPIDVRSATEFENKVWEVTCSIPYGEVRSYQFIAEKIGRPKAFRAVGQALKKNPLPIIIPCHRVIRSDGKSGGFLGGIEMKKNLLRLEHNRS
ncbi:MAG: methylated-DNA--[protein]-cysteine S-methyltransferase [bacterium]